MNKDTKTRMLALSSIINAVMIAVVTVVFNFLPEKVGIYRTVSDLSTFTPLLAPEFSNHLLGLNVWWGLAFSFHIALLATKRWTPALRWTQMALGFVGAFVLTRLAVDVPFLPSAGAALIRYLLVCVVLAQIFTAARRLNRLVNGRWLVFGPDPARE